MLDMARKKIDDEMTKDDTPYIQIVGYFLLKYLEQNPGAAEAILNKSKSIKQSMVEMKKAAEKRKMGNYAVLTEQEGFAVVLNYFGLNENPGDMKNSQSYRQPAPASAPKSEIDFDVKLEDLL